MSKGSNDVMSKELIVVTNSPRLSKIHPLDALGYVISDVSEVLRGLRSFNIRPPRSGNPTRVDQSPACVPEATQPWVCPL